ncbi:MAG: hypothetical protein AB1478_12070, partial [Nitrospirota bacterium]
MMRYMTLVPLKFTNKELHPGEIFTPKNKDAIRGLLAEGKVRPLSEVMAEKYRALTDWLHQFDLTGDVLPELYLDIQDAIERLDDAFYREDLPAFQDALDRVRLLFTEGLFRCGRRVAIKVWSEPLQAYLWVVETDQDMASLRSQVSEAIYTASEIRKLRGMDKDS